MKGSFWVTRPAMIHYATPRSHMLEMAKELFDLVLAGKIVQRAEPELRARGCRRSASRARIAQDDRRHRADALKSFGLGGTSPWTCIRSTPISAEPTIICSAAAPAWFAFAMTIGLMIFDYVDRQVIVSLFPYLKAAWGPSDKQLGALVSVVSVTVALGAHTGGAVRRPRQPGEEHRRDGRDLEPRDDLLHVHAQLRSTVGRALGRRLRRGRLRLGGRCADRQPLSVAHARRLAGRRSLHPPRSARCWA